MHRHTVKYVICYEVCPSLRLHNASTSLSSMDVLITSHYKAIRQVPGLAQPQVPATGPLWPGIDLEMCLFGPALKKEGPTWKITSLFMFVSSRRVSPQSLLF